MVRCSFASCSFQCYRQFYDVVLTMDLIEPLFDAVIKGDDSVVNHIINLGINLTVNDEEGLTALHWYRFFFC